jgi:formylglycine-generating enzyme required for sulfatase activity
MVIVPAGEFWMGSDSGDADESPTHLVYLDEFYIDLYEVTNAAYQVCVLNGVCGEPQDSSYYSDPAWAAHPVVYIDWYAAESYCEWRGARLPSESEWEKAARGTDQRTFPWGEGIDGSYANYNGELGGTTPVGSYGFGASAYGLYDMAGNVWEWVLDWYSNTYYQESPASNPFGPESGDGPVLRGGSFPDGAEFLRASYRLYKEPTFNNSDVGFRCARYAP